MTTLVWFKKDLRVEDHHPLFNAATGRVVCLYIYEPKVIGAPDYDASHLAYVNGCLQKLQEQLADRGGHLVLRTGNAVDVLEKLHQEVGFECMVSHQETGNFLTYQRDKAVGRWAKNKGVVWTETVQDGVVRALTDRDGWSRQWNAAMRSPAVAAPDTLHCVPGVASEGIQSPARFGLEAFDTSTHRFGTEAAIETLYDFLHNRGERYQSEMSSPNTADTSCSRMSTYLTYGVISKRSVFQTFEKRRDQVRAERKAKTGISADWSRAMASFNKRLHWNGHFIQRLEIQPDLEFTNMSRAMDGLREEEFCEERFQAWCEGRTGYPMVDACMRYLKTHRWINFRMRAMLVSFASYHLWLDWRRTAPYLATLFIDYEPGIHYSQIQMQSGTTGINSVRIYSPIKQASDHDPEGTFIRRWVPELAAVPPEHTAEPHKMSTAEQVKYGCIIGKDYPPPIVDHKEAVRLGKARVYAKRRGENAWSEAQAVLKRHGSRKRPRRRAKAS